MTKMFFFVSYLKDLLENVDNSTSTQCILLNKRMFTAGVLNEVYEFHSRCVNLNIFISILTILPTKCSAVMNICI